MPRETDELPSSGSSPEEGNSSVSRGIRDTACRSCSLQADTRWRALAHHDRAPCPTSCRRLFRFGRSSTGRAHEYDRSGCIGVPQDRKSTSELQSLMRISYAVFCLKKKKKATSVHTRPKSTWVKRE